ncbi:MAG: nucleotide exchange factor GrpE [Bacteroidales bacterium]|nr:nucleotide exchange factor GrpE [Bacteroidales bacterium]
MSEQKTRKEEHMTNQEQETIPQEEKETATTGQAATHEAGTEATDGKQKKEHQKHKKEKPSEKIVELEEALEGMKDKHLRLQAEFDNFRKRTLREKADLIKSGGESVLTAILPIVDDFERALVSMQEMADEDPSKVGFLLIYNKFRDFLKNNNVREIEAAGQLFDVDRHFAVTTIPSPTEELKGKIIDVIEKGYTLNDKVIRFAKVVIGE